MMLAESQTSLIGRLRAETRPAHDRLEEALGLVRGTPGREEVRQLLMRFHGFFAVWEPAVSSYLQDEAFLAPRRRLPLLRRDLLALGLGGDEVDALPACPNAAPFRCAAGAIGSLYVLEGSTLGGELISRKLAGAPWLPPGGLAYFRPYGPATGEMWRSFRRRLEIASSAETDDRILTSARLTFSRLHDWLCRGT